MIDTCSNSSSNSLSPVVSVSIIIVSADFSGAMSTFLASRIAVLSSSHKENSSRLFFFLSSSTSASSSVFLCFLFSFSLLFCFSRSGRKNSDSCSDVALDTSSGP